MTPAPTGGLSKGRLIRRIVVAIGAAGAIVLAALVAPYLSNPWMLLDFCQNTAIRSETSPDGRFRAVLFDRDCGATTGHSSQVSILPAGFELPNDAGNVFVAGSAADTKPAAWGGPLVDIHWRSRTRLEIRYDHTARVFHNEKSEDEITITYVAD